MNSVCRFSILAYWLCMGWSVCQAIAKEVNLNRAIFFWHHPVNNLNVHEVTKISGPSEVNKRENRRIPKNLCCSLSASFLGV